MFSITLAKRKIEQRLWRHKETAARQVLIVVFEDSGGTKVEDGVSTPKDGTNTMKGGAQ